MKNILVAIALLMVVAVGIAFYLGWLNVSTANSFDNSRSEVKLTIDKEKVQDDIDAVKKKAKEAGEKIGQTAREIKDEIKERPDVVVLGKTVDGQLTTIDIQKKELIVQSNDGKDTITVRVDGQTVIKVGDKDGTISDLKTGDTVSLVHMPKDGVDTAVSVVVKPVKS